MNERRRIASVTESAEDVVCVFQKFFFTELVLKRRSACPLINPFWYLKGGRMRSVYTVKFQWV